MCRLIEQMQLYSYFIPLPAEHIPTAGVHVLTVKPLRDQTAHPIRFIRRAFVACIRKLNVLTSSVLTSESGPSSSSVMNI